MSFKVQRVQINTVNQTISNETVGSDEFLKTVTKALTSGNHHVIISRKPSESSWTNGYFEFTVAPTEGSNLSRSYIFKVEPRDCLVSKIIARSLGADRHSLEQLRYTPEGSNTSNIVLTACPIR